MRRVVLSTNIAESSVTVPGVRFVIDFGLEKLPVYDARTKTQALLTRLCSRASPSKQRPFSRHFSLSISETNRSAAQRAGRCGRVAAGACLRLYSRAVFEGNMPEFISPEILRTPLQNVALKALLLDDDPAQLLSEALDAPSRGAVFEALEQHRPPASPFDRVILWCFVRVLYVERVYEALVCDGACCGEPYCRDRDFVRVGNVSYIVPPNRTHILGCK